MDIRNWGMDKILTLPDYCLSRRFTIFTALQSSEGTTQWDISELAIPDQAIIHEFVLTVSGAYGAIATMRLALGDHLPLTTAEMDLFEPLFHGFGLQGPDPRDLVISMPISFSLRRLKMYLPAQGRRLVMESTAQAGEGVATYAAIVVSAVPTEVPEWLIFGQDKDRK